MKICYVDESGCTGAMPSATSQVQPALVVAALIVDQGRLKSTTDAFLELKRKYFPNLFSADKRYFLTGILGEIKGADLRGSIATGGRNLRRHTFGFLDGVFKILEDNDIQIVARAWIKGIAVPVDGRAVYTFSSQSLCSTFQEYLKTTKDSGVVIFDSRSHTLNKQVAHSIFTQKFRVFGDAYDRIVDLPTFAHSDNHAGLQIADAIVSGVLFPLATFSYCTGHIQNVHVQPNHALIKARYGQRIRALQYRYTKPSGRPGGGIVVADALGQRPSSNLFQ